MKFPISDNFNNPNKNIFYILIIFPVLLVLSEFYLIVIKLRHFFYDCNLFFFFKTKKVDALVISVGNISVGGTGKTPIVIEIANMISITGKKCSVVSRGYKRESKGLYIVSNDKEIISSNPKYSGDEPLIIASETKIPVLCDSNRVRASKFAIENFGSRYIILDDGFQHRKIKKDLNIIIIDSSRFLGNEKTLPLGFLRDDINRLRKADKIIISKVFDKEKLNEQVNYLNNRYRIITENIFSSNLYTEFISNFKEKQNISFLQNKKIYAFCGLGNPHDFFKTLETLRDNDKNSQNIEISIEGKKIFPDHYKYTERDLDIIISDSEKSNSDLIITTEKDFVNFPKKYTNTKNLPKNIFFLKVESKFYDNKFEEEIGIEKIIDLKLEA